MCRSLSGSSTQANHNSAYLHWIDYNEINKTKVIADAAAAEATEAADEAEAAEKEGNSDKAAAAAARAEQAQAKVEQALEYTRELESEAETDEDNLGGPPDDEVSDPENVYGSDE